MKHRIRAKRLGRDTAARKALFKNLAKALLTRESIKTTKSKAREAQSYIEKLITAAKDNTPEKKRYIFGILGDKALIETLFNDIAPRFKERRGGYTRVIPLYPRAGDGAQMAILELVEKKVKVAPPKKAKKETSKKEESLQKESPKKEAKTAAAVKEEGFKAEVKEEIHKERAKEEQKKIQRKGLLKNLGRFFRGKAPS